MSIVTLFGGGEGDDTVRDPFVWAEDGRLRVPADEGKLLEVVILLGHQHPMRDTRCVTAYIQELR